MRIETAGGTSKAFLEHVKIFLSDGDSVAPRRTKG
jgi:hypothetical protein